MARSHARIYVSVWRDDGFTNLSAPAQRTYMMLLSQADLSYCGVIPYRPKRWAQLASDILTDDVEQDIDELIAAGMLLLDQVTDELWIRSFVKHDGILDVPNVRKASRDAFAHVMSEPIRKAFADTYPDVFVDPSPKGSAKGSRKGSAKGSGNPKAKTAGKGMGKGNGESLQPDAPSLVPPTVASDATDAPLVGELVAHYVLQYRATHRGFEPPRQFRNACGQQVKKLLREGYSADDLRKCLNAIASENRQPANLALTLADLHLEAAS